MAKSKWWRWLTGLAFIIVLAWFLLWSAITPQGQPPLTRLASDGALINQFNAAATNVRMVLLFSPT